MKIRPQYFIIAAASIFAVVFVLTHNAPHVDARAVAGPTYQDIGLRINEGTSAAPDIRHIAVEASNFSSSLMLAKNGTVYHIGIATIGDPSASKAVYATPYGYNVPLRLCSKLVDGSGTTVCSCLPDLQAFVKSHEVQLVWTPNDAHHYNVYRSLVSGGPYTFIASTTSTFSTYDDTGLINGTPYYYRIRPATISDVEHCTSAEVTGTPAAPGR